MPTCKTCSLLCFWATTFLCFILVSTPCNAQSMGLPGTNIDYSAVQPGMKSSETDAGDVESDEEATTFELRAGPEGCSTQDRLHTVLGKRIYVGYKKEIRRYKRGSVLRYALDWSTCSEQQIIRIAPLLRTAATAWTNVGARVSVAQVGGSYGENYSWLVLCNPAPDGNNPNVLAKGEFPGYPGIKYMRLFPLLFAQDDTYVVRSLTHEMGHMLGLRHEQQPESDVPYPINDGKPDPLSIMTTTRAASISEKDIIGFKTLMNLNVGQINPASGFSLKSYYPANAGNVYDIDQFNPNGLCAASLGRCMRYCGTRFPTMDDGQYACVDAIIDITQSIFDRGSGIYEARDRSKYRYPGGIVYGVKDCSKSCAGGASTPVAEHSITYPCPALQFFGCNPTNGRI